MLIEKKYIRKVQQISAKENKNLFFTIPFDFQNFLKLKKGMKVELDIDKDKRIIVKILKEERKW